MTAAAALDFYRLGFEAGREATIRACQDARLEERIREMQAARQRSIEDLLQQAIGVLARLLEEGNPS